MGSVLREAAVGPGVPDGRASEREQARGEERGAGQGERRHRAGEFDDPRSLRASRHGARPGRGVIGRVAPRACSAGGSADTG